MAARKWVVRVLILSLVSTALAGAVGCESTGGGGYQGGDGHVGHSH